MARPRKPVYQNPAWSDLGVLAEAWTGWRVRGDLLISPEGYKVPMPWVRALPLTREALHTYRVSSARDRQTAQEARRVVLTAETARSSLDALEAALRDLRGVLYPTGPLTAAPVESVSFPGRFGEGVMGSVTLAVQQTSQSRQG